MLRASLSETSGRSMRRHPDRPRRSPTTRAPALAFASRALTDTETRQPSLKRNAGGRMEFGEIQPIYLRPEDDVVSNHTPLECILKKA